MTEKPVTLTKSKILNNKELTVYYKSIFKCCDKNGDGFVSVGELKEFLESNENCNIPDNVLECIVNQFDKNFDTKLDFEEFMEMVNHKTFTDTFQNLTNRIFRFIVLPYKKTEHATLKKTITNTGIYEKQLKFGFNTIGMIIISTIQIILFYLDCVKKIKLSDRNEIVLLGPIGKALYFHPCDKIKIYRYVSYMLVHSGGMHLSGNVIIQTVLGIPLEMIHSWRVIVIYIIGVIGGALVHTVFDRTEGLVGGSGGAFTLMTAHISVVIMNWREMSHPAVHLILFTLVVSVDVFLNITNLMDRTSYLCHSGGAIVGLLLGVIIVRNLKITKKEYIFWYICCVGLIVFFTILITLDFTLSTDIDCADFKNYVPNCNNTIYIK